MKKSKTIRRSVASRTKKKGSAPAKQSGPAVGEKLLFLIWAPADWSRGQIGDRLLKTCAPRLIRVGARRLEMHLTDPESDVKCPSPNLYGKRAPCAMVGIRVADPQVFAKLAAVFSAEGLTAHAYHVEESIYRDYGQNPHAAPRSWPDGVRSPGITMVTLMERPQHIPHDEWLRRWHGNMSPLSESIQPRTRYVRNVVRRALTPSAPPFEGMVSESWPSVRHVNNPFLFYGARKNPFLMPVNMARILLAVHAFLRLHKMQSVMMSEFFLKSR